MTRFEQWFGAGPTLRLQTTFRCPQSICDVASAFVSKNPHQLRKVVVSNRPEAGAPVAAVSVASSAEIAPTIAGYLDDLARRLRLGELSPARGERLTVDVLGRYQFDRQLVPARWPAGLQVTFRTVHGSKGLEADVVIVPNLTSGTYGFPSRIADDPVLDLVMASPHRFPDAEERRLFYVALTRARREVLLVSVRGEESPFLVELIGDGRVALPRQSPDERPPQVCPTCRRGLLVERRGPHGAFLACRRFPRCTHTQGLPSRPGHEGPPPGAVARPRQGGRSPA